VLQGRHILLIISGGIAAYKSLDLIRRMRERGLGVRCILTNAAKQFITALSASALAGEPAFTELFDADAEFDLVRALLHVRPRPPHEPLRPVDEIQAARALEVSNRQNPDDRAVRVALIEAYYRAGEPERARKLQNQVVFSSEEEKRIQPLVEKVESTP